MRYVGIAHAERAPAGISDVAASRETLRVLLTAHFELTEVASELAQQLRALLLRGNADDHALSRSGLSHTVLSTLANRKPPGDATLKQATRHGEIQHLAQVIMAYRDELSANRQQMATVVNELVPGITSQPGMGPFKAARAILDSP